MKTLYFKSPGAFRAWLEANHDSAAEVVVGFYKVGTGKPSLTWPEAVDQALCYGWIDGIRQRVDDERYSNRFTPRRPGSNWSAVNIRRIEELDAMGLLHPAGKAAFERRDPTKSGVYSFEREPATFDSQLSQMFQLQEQAWEFFRTQAPSYQRTATHWVMTAKKEETRLRRLSSLIEASAKGERLSALSPRRNRQND